MGVSVDQPRNNYDAPFWQKCAVVFTTSWMTLAATFSSTSLFDASTEVADDLGSTPTVIDVVNAFVFLAMGLSTFVWGPISALFGRAIAYNGCIAVLALFTIGTALAPNFQAFVALRILSGFQGTFFHVTGQAILSDFFPPLQRGIATGVFLSGTILGPPLGPLVSGIIITLSTWRTILWVQCGMIGFGLAFSLVFLPIKTGTPSIPLRDRTLMSALGEFNPWPILRVFGYPKVAFSDLAAGLLAWAQYCILATPQQFLSTQYHLTSPVIAGLYYLSPGVGFILGSTVGGHLSDRTVRKWIEKRDGTRLPRDRLRSGFVSFFFVIPVALLIYGWGIEKNVGGLALPIVTSFFAAGGVLAAFAGLNTFCAEVMPEYRREVIATKYLIQYAFSTGASGSSVVFIEAAGAGLQSTVAVIFVILGGIITLVIAVYGNEKAIEPEKPSPENVIAAPVPPV